jgi:protein-S-isoprenylcysteine O-methyltransferase Ste14
VCTLLWGTVAGNQPAPHDHFRIDQFRMTTSISTPRLRITLAWYVIVLVLVAISKRPWANLPSGEVASIAGLVLMAGAALGRVWVSAFIAGSKDERLVTTGPYALCRHPLYALSLLGGVGVGLATRSIVLLTVTVVLLTWLHLRAIDVEERALDARHGTEFQRYRATVPSLIPRTLQKRSPELVQLNVEIYWKVFLDAGSFIALYAAIAALDALRAAHRLPTVLVLW